MPSGEEIQHALAGFVTKWQGYTGSEKSEAQTFLNELDEAVVDCYGWPRAVAQDADELVRLLTERNHEIVEDGRAYDPFKTVGSDT
jgi:hypothetical protein